MAPVRLTPQERAALLRRHLDDGVLLTRLAEYVGVPLRTLHRWAGIYRAGRQRRVAAAEDAQ